MWLLAFFILFGVNFTFWTLVGVFRFGGELAAKTAAAVARLMGLEKRQGERLNIVFSAQKTQPRIDDFQFSERLIPGRSWWGRLRRRLAFFCGRPPPPELVISIDLDRLPMAAVRHEREIIPQLPDQSSVAVLMPAHNEERVIADALSILVRIVPPTQIFIANDASQDRTAEIARSFGCNVYDMFPNRGKAGALAAALDFFGVYDRYQFVLFVDADTRLQEDYLIRALPHFVDPEVATVAGFAYSQWKNNPFIAYRSRLWFIVQIFFRFGMSWRFTNVNMIVPGFASMYRTNVLRQIDIAKPGMVIEDYNMTFELHRKRLGRIVNYPSIAGFTQDPDTFQDYCRQIRRWNLGFWQTIKVNGLWPSWFWFNLGFYLFELVLTSLFFLALPPAIVAAISGYALGFDPPWAKFVLAMVLWLLAVDYALSFIVAIFQRRPQLLFYGFLMFFFRWLDAWYFLLAIPLAFWTTSSGQWISPQRWSRQPTIVQR